jgi:hypothetical protein
MILPTKHLPENRSLIGVGGSILSLLAVRERTVSATWEAFSELRGEDASVSFDWFILGLDLLFAIGAVELDRGVLRKRSAA